MRTRSLQATPLDPPFARGEGGRRASTLTEVLVALLVMSIGVVSLATLFPISILRTIQATQMTSARIVRDNARTRMDAQPHLVHDPDRDGDSGEHLGGNYIVDPLGWFEMDLLDGQFNNNNDPLRDWFGHRDEPPFPPNFRLRRWAGFSMPNGITQAAALNRAAQTVMLPDSWVQQYAATPTGFDNQQGQWVQLPSTFNPAGIPIRVARDEQQDGNGNGILDTRQSPVSRVILRGGATGRSAQVRTITRFRQRRVEWDESINFVPERVRIQTQQRHYTWFLTVRKQSSGSTNVDVVVVFRRSYDPEDEHVYLNVDPQGQDPPANNPAEPFEFLRAPVNPQTGDPYFGYDEAPGVAGVNDDGDGRVDEVDLPGVDDDGDGQVDEQDEGGEQGYPGSDDNRTVRLQWSSGDEPAPQLRAGSWILDMQNARWYRIQEILEEDEATGEAALLVDRDIVENGAQGAVIPRGVVHVFTFLR